MVGTIPDGNGRPLEAMLPVRVRRPRCSGSPSGTGLELRPGGAVGRFARAGRLLGPSRRPGRSGISNPLLSPGLFRPGQRLAGLKRRCHRAPSPGPNEPRPGRGAKYVHRSPFRGAGKPATRSGRPGTSHRVAVSTSPSRRRPHYRRTRLAHAFTLSEASNGPTPLVACIAEGAACHRQLKAQAPTLEAGPKRYSPPTAAREPGCGPESRASARRTAFRGSAPWWPPPDPSRLSARTAAPIPARATIVPSRPIRPRPEPSWLCCTALSIGGAAKSTIDSDPTSRQQMAP